MFWRFYVTYRTTTKSVRAVGIRKKTQCKAQEAFGGQSEGSPGAFGEQLAAVCNLPSTQMAFWPSRATPKSVRAVGIRKKVRDFVFSVFRYKKLTPTACGVLALPGDVPGDV